MCHRLAATPYTFSLSLDTTTDQAVPRARRQITSAVRAWELPLSDDELADVALCASEILTNAVCHTNGQVTVTTQWTGDRLRIEVQDTSLRLPEQTCTEAYDTAGRGLALVEAVATAWGWEPCQAGKTVWFELAAVAAEPAPVADPPTIQFLPLPAHHVRTCDYPVPVPDFDDCPRPHAAPVAALGVRHCEIPSRATARFRQNPPEAMPHPWP